MIYLESKGARWAIKSTQTIAVAGAAVSGLWALVQWLQPAGESSQVPNWLILLHGFLCVGVYGFIWWYLREVRLASVDDFAAQSLRLLKDIRAQFDPFAVELAITPLEAMIRGHRPKVNAIISGLGSPEIWTWNVVMRTAGDLAESGRHHSGRGTLNPLAADLLRMHDVAADQLASLKHISAEQAEKEKLTLRKNVAFWG